MLEAIWEVVNSPLVIAGFAAVVVWLLNKLYSAKPTWEKFEGTIIAAVKAAEKAVPDDSESSAAQKLDAALKYVLSVYEEVEGKRADAATTAELTEAIQVTHAELETAGTLGSATEETE